MDNKNIEDILNKLATVQDKFNGIGITFLEDMEASYSDVLEYTDTPIGDMGYTKDTFTPIVEICKDLIKKIEGCGYITAVLSRLSTYFSSVQVQSDNDTTDTKDTEDKMNQDKYDVYINTVPKILTIVISVYKVAISAAREYTTTALSIESSIVKYLS